MYPPEEPQGMDEFFSKERAPSTAPKDYSIEQIPGTSILVRTF